MDSAQFTDRSKMTTTIPEHDVRVTEPQGLSTSIEHHWLPRAQDGQAITVRFQDRVAPPPASSVT